MLWLYLIWNGAESENGKYIMKGCKLMKTSRQVLSNYPLCVLPSSDTLDLRFACLALMNPSDVWGCETTSSCSKVVFQFSPPENYR